MSLVTSPLSLTENLNAQRRKLLRIQTIIEDAGSGSHSTLAPLRKDGEVDQIKMAAVLDSAVLMLREVIKALDDVVTRQRADSERAAP